MDCQSSDEVYASARELFFAGQLAESRQLLQRALQADCEEGSLWELLGEVYYTLGERHSAIDALEHANLLIPLSCCGEYVLASCYERTGKRPLARDYFRHLAYREDIESNLLEPLARALGRLGDPQTALQVCRVASTRFPEATEPLMGMVYYLRWLQSPLEHVLPCLFRAHHLAPEDTSIRITLACSLHAVGQSRDAAELLCLLDVDEFECCDCVERMRDVFWAAEASECAKNCDRRLAELKEGVV